MEMFTQMVDLYKKNFNLLPSFIVKACLLANAKTYLDRLFEMASDQFDFENHLIGPEVLECFNFGGPVRVRLRNFSDFHEALNSLNKHSLL